MSESDWREDYMTEAYNALFQISEAPNTRDLDGEALELAVAAREALYRLERMEASAVEAGGNPAPQEAE